MLMLLSYRTRLAVQAKSERTAQEATVGALSAPKLSNGTGRSEMNWTARQDHQGRMRLRCDRPKSATERCSGSREIDLCASPDGMTIVLIEFEDRFSDHHATGPLEEGRHEITVSELVELIRAHGARI
jgi:hypothetical protein